MDIIQVGEVDKARQIMLELDLTAQQLFSQRQFTARTQTRTIARCTLSKALSSINLRARSPLRAGATQRSAPTARQRRISVSGARRRRPRLRAPPAPSIVTHQHVAASQATAEPTVLGRECLPSRRRPGLRRQLQHDADTSSLAGTFAQTPRRDTCKAFHTQLHPPGGMQSGLWREELD